jgi:DNA-directed RNA polymerase specialized sigma24 family protein
MYKKLIEKSKRGDIQSFENLIKEYKIYVYNISLIFFENKMEAEDISQEAILKAFENISDKEIDSEILKNSIYKLKDEDKIIIYFKDVLDLNYSEIKHILQCDRDIIKSKISQARTSLNDLVNKGILKC